MAYALLPTEDGRFVACELRKVRFEDVAPADPRGVHSKPTPEHRSKAIDRVQRGVHYRTMHMPGGWHTGYAKRGC